MPSSNSPSSCEEYAKTTGRGSRSREPSGTSTRPIRQFKEHIVAAFQYCFNTSTIRGQKLSLLEEIDIVAQAGYHAIEPWTNEIEAYVKQGGSLRDLKKRISDL